ncbi:MAG TPA: hypothetical protein VJ728_09445 [Candidatus Binataceae bacterium]|nr:hypothetical protein [Candidatus Binataceae bacterium]
MKISSLALALLLAISLPQCSEAAAHKTDVADPAVMRPPLPVNQIVRRMEARNRERASALHQFHGTRIYQMDYHGFFGHHEAEMVVAVDASTDGKKFTIISEEGSKFVLDHVLKRLLKGEKEATNDENRRRTALDTDNYNFSLTGYEDSPAGTRYILTVVPKTNNKYLYRGKIWVDGKDFAVCRIQARPAKSPSFWIKKTEINHKYTKVGDFWLPEENHSESWIRFGGHAVLTIAYRDYQIIDAAPVNSTGYLQQTYK